MSGDDALRAAIAAAICPGTYCESHDECREDADAVLALPELEAWAEQRARERAAEELRAAADEGLSPYGLYDRADALAADDRTGQR